MVPYCLKYVVQGNQKQQHSNSLSAVLPHALKWLESHWLLNLARAALLSSVCSATRKLSSSDLVQVPNLEK